MTTMQADTTDTTTDKLAEMLTENTGRSFLDSGDYYGRNWEQNQGADFESRPEGRLEFWIPGGERNGELDIVPTVNVYHFLKDRLDYNSELDQRYREFVEREALYLDINSALSFVNTLDNAAGIYGDGKPFTTNTYNGEDLLSQILQYVYWSDEDGAHVMLQIHGGCDARGGYTTPVVFDVADHDGTSIFDNARASIYCNDCGKHWDTYDGCHWEDDCGDSLRDYPATDQRPEYPEPLDPAQHTLPIDLPERPEPCAGIVWVDDERNGHCPYCGGILNITPWPCG